MFKKIDHINIVVFDLEAAKDFFLDLGFTVMRRQILQGEWINKLVGLPDVKAEYIALAIPDTQTKIELLKYHTPEGERDTHISMPNHIGFRHIALEVQDIENKVAHLEEKGIPFFSDIQVIDNLKKLCYFLGPEGIILELDEYF